MREQTQRALRDPKLKGVVFVVDVAALIRNGAIVAEYVPKGCIVRDICLPTA